MKRIYSGLILSFILVATLVTISLAQKPKATSMETRWKKVEQYAQQDLPESALKEVDAILEQAKKDNNSPEIIKAMVSKMRFIIDKNPDETEKLIREFEVYTNKTTNPAEKAIMLSMTAELYCIYYQNDQYKIDRRTEFQGFEPDDMKEWTKNIFVEKIVKYANLSLGDAEVLQKTKSQTYAPIIDQGKDSRDMQPTLFDFLAYRKIEILENFNENDEDEDTGFDMISAVDTTYTVISGETSTGLSEGTQPEQITKAITETYDQLIFFNKKQKNKPATIYAELQKLDFTNQEKDENYLKELERLENQNSDNESVVEVMAAKAHYLLDKENESDKTDNSKKLAFDIASEGIKKYPKYKRIGILENIRRQLLQKSVESYCNIFVRPNSPLKINLTSKNIKTLKLSVYRLNITSPEYYMYRANRQNDRQLYPKHTLVSTQTINPAADPNMNSVTTGVEIKTGDYGIYEFVLEENKPSASDEKAVGFFITTDLSFIQRNAGNRTNDIFVLNRTTGNPEKNVNVTSYEKTWGGSAYQIKLQNHTLTNADGLATLRFAKDYGDNLLVFEKGNDKYFTEGSDFYDYGLNQASDMDDDAKSTSLFTDRSLYRPGQTVYFKGIIYKSKKQEIVAGENATIELFNANNEKTGEKTVKTNEFGSFSGEFILPESGLNGAYRLQSGGNSVSIWVEEYKRPTFEVTVNRPKEEVRFGEEVKVKGEVKAYAGYAIPNAAVKYRVVRRPHRFWWWHSEPEQVIASGTTTTGADGSYEVSFIPKKGKTSETGWWRGNNDQFYSYTVYADVTDTKGETQQGEQTISVGDKSLFILAEIAPKVEKSKPLTLDVTTQTLNGELVVSAVNYCVEELQPSALYYEELNDTTRLKELHKVMSGSFHTKEKLTLDLKKLPSGIYKITFKTRDNRGNEVKEAKRFVLYENNDKKPPVKTYSWFIPEKTEVYSGENAVVKFGTSTRNTAVLYELMQGKTVLERRWITFNDEIQTFSIPFTAAYGAGITVVFTFVKDEKIFTQQVNITRKYEEKKLTPTVSVFRDMLKPGEKAEWTINIPQSGDKKTAELLIGMYDASLDAIRPHNWTFDPAYHEFIPWTPAWTFRGTDSDNINIWFREQYKNVPDYEFDELNWFGLPLGYRRWYGNRNARFSASVMRKSSRGESVMEMEVLDASFSKSARQSDEMAVNAITLNESVTVSTQSKKEESGGQAEKPAKVRENFNETAFFYPQLHTDKKGNVKVSFTSPESLTRWNVKMMAHTADLYFGQETMQAITQKELMVQMNLPRFVRRSDKLTLAANVINMTENAVTATVELEIINPETNKQVALQSENQQKITLDPKGTKAVEWKLNELKDFDLVTAKVTAESENFSDGEQKYLPVLPDKVMITENQPLTTRSGQTRTFEFSSFINQMKSVDTKSFTVEFADNPAWYAVQALPTLSEPASENAIDYLTAYYVNKLAGYIANANPKISGTFDQWKKTGGNRDALLSNLQKNQELKNMLLEETPWIMEAKDETEQKKRIALLFDLNQQKNQSDKYLDKLLKLQTPNGGFSWFEKMPESRYITQEVLLNLARLNKMTKENRGIREDDMVKKALNYLDLMMAKDFAELKKWNKEYDKNNVINNLQLFYLHMRSEYKDVPVAETAKPAVEFYRAQSEKYWTSFTLYGKAMMATVAHRNEKKQIANSIMKSLSENALKTDELGMYWARNTSGWSWYERPIAVQTALIEAFTEISEENAEADEMKIWLLKQKQTQRWDTPISTTDAIYALLNYGSDWLADTGDTTIKLGGRIITPSAKEAGTGYFREDIPVATLKPESGKITVSGRGSKGIGWGAAYWQYYQNQDQVKSHGKEMNISKKLFVEKVVNGKKTIVPAEQTALNKGDKVITRLVLTTGRDLEFVVLKDLRAACLEPVDQTSGFEWRDGAGYYRTIKDASTQYFFDFLPKGTYVFEYEVWVSNTGTFTSGISSVQCMYAPEFASHTGGEKIMIN